MGEVKLYSIVYEGCGTNDGESICIGFYRTYDTALEKLTQLYETLSIPDNQIYVIQECNRMVKVFIENGNASLSENDVDEDSKYISTTSLNKSYGYIEGLSIIQVIFK